jgi:PAS domain S-box-containing protein
MVLMAQAEDWRNGDSEDITGNAELQQAEALLVELASAFSGEPGAAASGTWNTESAPEAQTSNIAAKYRALLEQIPAVVFMAYVDRGTSEAYVSPEIEAALGYSREEWLEDPVRWYGRIHPDDKQRWSLEAAEMFLSGKPLRSSYRVLARDGRVVWFHCDARMVRRPDGQPWFIHGVAFDISDLKHTERALQRERNFVSAILDTAGALVAVLDGEGRMVRTNRAFEQTTGYSFEQLRGKHIWEFFLFAEEVARSQAVLAELRPDFAPQEYQSHWLTQNGSSRLIAWSSSLLPDNEGKAQYVIATGIDITEREQLEKALLNISAREQRRIGQDLHDGLGQHLTGIAFMAKVHEDKLAKASLPEAADAAKIVRLVNEAVHKTRVMARGLFPVMSDAQGLMSALQVWVGEVEDVFGVTCKFECERPVLIEDNQVATHLYHIAQEAVNNAMKHGHAGNILLRLSAQDDYGTLLISDDGIGIGEESKHSQGMGLHIMSYRSAMVGGRLTVRRNETQGTTVCCVFPLKAG